MWNEKAIINQSTSNTNLFTVCIVKINCMSRGVLTGSIFNPQIKINYLIFFPPLTELTATIKCEKTYEICEGCSQKIYDRYYLNVADKSWHESCLTCNICNLLLNYKCYVRNSKLYCKDDYYR